MVAHATNREQRYRRPPARLYIEETLASGTKQRPRFLRIWNQRAPLCSVAATALMAVQRRSAAGFSKMDAQIHPPPQRPGSAGGRHTGTN